MSDTTGSEPRTLYLGEDIGGSLFDQLTVVQAETDTIDGSMSTFGPTVRLTMGAEPNIILVGGERTYAKTPLVQLTRVYDRMQEITTKPGEFRRVLNLFFAFTGEEMGLVHPDGTLVPLPCYTRDENTGRDPYLEWRQLTHFAKFEFQSVNDLAADAIVDEFRATGNIEPFEPPKFRRDGSAVGERKTETLFDYQIRGSLPQRLGIAPQMDILNFRAGDMVGPNTVKITRADGTEDTRQGFTSFVHHFLLWMGICAASYHLKGNSPEAMEEHNANMRALANITGYDLESSQAIGPTIADLEFTSGLVGTDGQPIVSSETGAPLKTRLNFFGPRPNGLPNMDNTPVKHLLDGVDYAGELVNPHPGAGVAPDAAVAVADPTEKPF